MSLAEAFAQLAEEWRKIVREIGLALVKWAERRNT